MKKNLLFIAILTLVLASLIIRLFFFGQDEAVEIPVGEDNTNVVNPDMALSTSSLVASRTGMGTVIVRDFLKDQDIEEYDDSTILIARENSVDGIPWYEIFYFKDDRTITISLQSIPLATARALAERELLVRLGVSEAQLCNLNIRVTVPRDLSEELSGRNLGLSVCPNSVNI